MLAQTILEEAEQLKEEIRKNRRYLHSHPGTGFDIAETVDYVREQLTKMGYKPVRCGKAGLIATVSGGKPGKVFLLRADMDGLPIAEESGESFTSENPGAMHACGHDMHTAMLLGAARILKQHESELVGTVKLMFQPAEEIFEGSRDMIAAGLLNNPQVDGAMMIHVMAGMPFPAGTAIVSAPGVSAPAADYFQIQVQGTGCHGSMPNTGVDPVSIAAHIITGLQEINARELALQEQAVLTIGTIHAGEAANVVPDSVIMGGTLRTFDEEVRSFIKKRMTEIAQGVAGAYRGKAEVTFGSGCPTLINDSVLSEKMLVYTKELLGAQGAFSVAELSRMSGGKGASGSAGSEDFAYVSQQVPSIMVALAAGEPTQGYCYPQHHPKVRFDEAALAKGSALYAYSAMRFLND